MARRFFKPRKVSYSIFQNINDGHIPAVAVSKSHRRLILRSIEDDEERAKAVERKVAEMRRAG